MFEDTEGGHIYLYTTKQVNLVSRVLVARTETLDLGSPWSYYIRDLSGDYHWRAPCRATRRWNVPTSRPNRVRCRGSSKRRRLLHVHGGLPLRPRHLPLPQPDALRPLHRPDALFTLPATLDKLGSPYHQRWYMINLHPALSRQGELVFSTNSDPANFWDNFNRVGSADFYRPYFFRVYNWEHVYDSDDDSGTGTEE